MDSGQPLLFPPVLVPALDTARYSTRRQGDGMDSEALQSSLSTLSSNLAQKRHTNLNTSAKSTSVTKKASSSFIPREPVKGAVKAVNGPKSKLNPAPPADGDIDQNVLKPYQHVSGTGTTTQYGKSNPSQSTIGYRRDKEANKGTAGLSSKLQQQKVNEYEDIEQGSKNISQPTDQICAIEIPLDGERQVEGQQARLNPEVEREKLKKELGEAKEALNVQLKVNADLKKMLVASVGDDLHYKVESLVRTKAHLSEEIGGYTKKMTKDFEDLDQLSIQADMWRSKYMACRVLTDQLASDKEKLTLRFADAERALQHMLQEREQLNNWMIETHRHVKLIRDSFDPASSHKTHMIPNMLELARDNMLLSESAKFRLLGSISVFRAALDAGIQNGPTPAEKLAYQVLSNKACSIAGDAGSVIPGRLSGELLTRMERFHPQVRYDNITFNCCRKCKGEIQVV